MANYTVIIAEKPSVAASIAKIVGATTPHKDKANGYLEGNGYRVTWAFGHLVGLDSPEKMGYTNGELPMLPDAWPTHIICGGKPATKDYDRMIEKQMNTLESLFAGASSIIVATDAGREGELIFRYIYEYLGSKTPFRRLWISSLTDEAIRKGLNELRPGKEYDLLSDAAHARSEADWLVGFNASRALRTASGYKKNLSLGRVQTPVLGMVCERYLANKSFVPTPFWQISAMATKDAKTFQMITVNKYHSENEAIEDKERVCAHPHLRVTSVDKKRVTTTPPLLYDLTSLQRAANTKLGLTAEQTLKVAQSLYEKKYLSYPRTGSRYISEDVFKEMPKLIAKVRSYDRFSDAAGALTGKKLCRKSVDDGKVTDHHALLPTENIPGNLTGDEKDIWEMVCGRMLEAMGENSLSDRTTVEAICEGVRFKATGSVIVYLGWKSVFGAAAEEKKKSDEDDDEPDAGELPAMKEGDILPADKIGVLTKTDKPLPIYTDSSLLGEMETCGKKIDDDELRESMKDVGLGTPATRAATIEGLIKREYIVRQSKKLIPTELGQEIWKIVKGRRIADVKTTGEWERDLAQIEKGTVKKNDFDRSIRQFTLDIIDDIQKNCRPLDGVSVSTEPEHTCPCCGNKMANLKFNIVCDAEKGGCGLKVPRVIADKTISGKEIDALFEKGKTGMIKGFKSKSGKKFEARLAIDRENRKVVFVFDNQATGTQMQGRKCPCCGEPLEDRKSSLQCGSCGFTLWKSSCGVALTEKQMDSILSGEGALVKGMKGKNGKTFSATIVVNKKEKKTDFVFEKKKE